MAGSGDYRGLQQPARRSRPTWTQLAALPRRQLSHSWSESDADTAVLINSLTPSPWSRFIRSNDPAQGPQESATSLRGVEPEAPQRGRPSS